MVYVCVFGGTHLLVGYVDHILFQMLAPWMTPHLYSGILIMRLYIMYRCNRTFLITLCVLFVAELTVEIVIMAEVIYGLQGGDIPVYSYYNTDIPIK